MKWYERNCWPPTFAEWRRAYMQGLKFDPDTATAEEWEALDGTMLAAEARMIYAWHDLLDTVKAVFAVLVFGDRGL